MKNRGLKNRFDPDDRYVWQFWYSCMICRKNGFDALHHIVSPTLRLYVKGSHNKSIFNSCPIHNFGCHIGKEHILNRDEMVSELLKSTFWALIETQGYKPVQRDLEFLMTYQHLYGEDSKEMIKSLCEV